MLSAHGLNIGHSDNLVFLNEFLDILQVKDCYPAPSGLLHPNFGVGADAVLLWKLTVETWFASPGKGRGPRLYILRACIQRPFSATKPHEEEKGAV